MSFSLEYNRILHISGGVVIELVYDIDAK